MLSHARLTALACFSLAIAPLCSAWGTRRVPYHKPVQEWDAEDLREYFKGLLLVTAFGGLLLWVLWQLLQLGCCCYCCFASKRNRKFERKRPRIQKIYSYSQTISDKLLERTSGERGFYIGAAVLSLSLIACELALWRYSTEFETSSMEVYDGVYDFTNNFAGFLCSKDRADACSELTIGAYLRDAEDEAEYTFDSVHAYLGELSTLAEGLDTAIDEAYNALGALDDMETTSDRINDNVEVADDMIKDIKQDYPYLKNEMPDDIDPNADWNVIIEALISVTNAQLKSIDVQDDLADYYLDAIEDLRDRIDGDSETGETDDRIKLNEIVDGLIDNIYNIRDRLLDSSDDIEDGRPFAEDALFYSKLILSVFFAIPVIVLGSTSLCKSRVKGLWPMHVNMTFICGCQLFFCVLTGAVMLVAILLDDVCVTNMKVIRTTAGNYSVVLGDSTVYLADAVEGILKCGHNRRSTVPQNIAAILTIDDEFNVTEYTDPVVEQLFEIRDHILDQTEQLQDALDDMDNVYDAFSDFDGHILQYNNNAKKGIKDVDKLLGEIPSTNMANDRDDQAEQDKVEAWFTFNFDSYGTAIEELNSELAKMSFIPSPFTDQLTPQTVQALTPSVLASDEWADEDDSGTCDNAPTNCANYSSTTYAVVKGLAEDVYNDFTVPLNAIILQNNGAVAALNALRATLVAIQDDIGLIDLQEDVVLGASDGVTDGVSQMMADIHSVVENVTSQIELINDIVDFIATSPDYLGCEWIGRLYVKTWSEDFCEGSVGAMNDSYGPMLAITMLMMCSFGLAAIYIPVIVKERELKAAAEADCICIHEHEPPPKFLASNRVGALPSDGDLESPSHQESSEHAKADDPRDSHASHNSRNTHDSHDSSNNAGDAHDPDRQSGVELSVVRRSESAAI